MLLLVTVLLVLSLLLLIYRSPMLALVPLFVVGVVYVIASGVVYLLAEDGLKVDSTATSLLADPDVRRRHRLLPAARRPLQGGPPRFEDQTEALRHAIPRAAPAIVASGLTVAAALLTLLASELDTNRTLGPVTAIGVVVVLLASITLLPAILEPARPPRLLADGQAGRVRPGRRRPEPHRVQMQQARWPASRAG